MGWLTRSVAWIYDFLAEDMTILIGSAVAIALAVLAVHVARTSAGYVLWVFILLAIAVSVWRTASAAST